MVVLFNRTSILVEYFGFLASPGLAATQSLGLSFVKTATVGLQTVRRRGRAPFRV